MASLLLCRLEHWPHRMRTMNARPNRLSMVGIYILMAESTSYYGKQKTWYKLRSHIQLKMK